MPSGEEIIELIILGDGDHGGHLKVLLMMPGFHFNEATSHVPRDSEAHGGEDLSRGQYAVVESMCTLSRSESSHMGLGAILLTFTFQDPHINMGMITITIKTTS